MSTRIIEWQLLLMILAAHSLFGQAAGPEVSIVSPADGATVVSGQSLSVMVRVQGVQASQIRLACLTGNFDHPDDSTWYRFEEDAPFTSTDIAFNVLLPAGIAPGPYFLNAVVGLADLSGQPMQGTPFYGGITIQIEPAQILKPLELPGPNITLNYVGDETEISIRDANGITLDRSLRLSKRTDDPNVAVIVQRHLLAIRATGAGKTKVWFEDAPITVEVANAKRGDYNADGLVNILDIQILDLYASSVSPEYQRARQPNDARDLNGDGTINAADVTVLRTLCDFPNCTIFAAPKAIKPLVGCVEPAGTANRAAYFSYRNENARAWPVPVGDGNFVSPGAQSQGQPAWFESGTVSRAFSVPFTSGTIVWTLKGPDGTQDTATASGSSPVCGP